MPGFRLVKLVRGLRSGSGTLSPLFWRNNRVTRPCSSVVTPYQVAIDASVSQLSLCLQLEPSVASYSATNAALSSGASGIVKKPGTVADTCSAQSLVSPASFTAHIP